MKNYNIQNYIRYKKDVEKAVKRLEGKMWDEYTREELVIKFLPLVENIARKFSTSQQACGVMTIMDLIQCGSVGLVQASKKLDYDRWLESDDMEKTIKSFFSKRIKGSIRRQIDTNRGNIRIPEHKMNEIRKNFGKDKKMVEMFFNSILLRLSYGLDCDKHNATQIADYLGIEGSSAYVRVSQLKRQAVNKLIENVDHSQVLDFL